jgi:hypothetical protein
MKRRNQLNFKQFQIEFDKLAKETLFLKRVGTGRDPKGVVGDMENKNLPNSATNYTNFH